MHTISQIIDMYEFETVPILKQLASTRAVMWELKGLMHTIPNTSILISTLSLQEAKESSEIENIITTHDELYQSNYQAKKFATQATKEVYRYAQALEYGYQTIHDTQSLTINDIVQIQSIVEGNNAGIRKIPGTELKNDITGETVYIPPQSYDEVIRLMTDVERAFNTHPTIDPLIMMTILHHQFESIHPFYDGNGRVWRILNVLYLVQTWLLDIPILYLSRDINQNKADYYRYLQAVRDAQSRQERVIRMLRMVAQSTAHTIKTIETIKKLMMDYKQRIKNNLPQIYSHELLNNIFKHPYTKISFMMNDIWCTRITASKYLQLLVDQNILDMIKIGRENYYINTKLFDLLRKIGD